MKTLLCVIQLLNMEEALLVIKNFLLIFLVVSSSACYNKDKLTRSYFYNADPALDAKKAINREDFRFYGVYKHNLLVPGVQKKCVKNISDIRIIEGTSDSFNSYHEMQFNVLAELYAESYNNHIEFYLASQKNDQCFYKYLKDWN